MKSSRSEVRSQPHIGSMVTGASPRFQVWVNLSSLGMLPSYTFVRIRTKINKISRSFRCMVRERIKMKPQVCGTLGGLSQP